MYAEDLSILFITLETNFDHTDYKTKTRCWQQLSSKAPRTAFAAALYRRGVAMLLQAAKGRQHSKQKTKSHQEGP